MLTFYVTITHYQSLELPFTLEPIAIVLSCLQINNDLHITEPKGQFSDLTLCDPSTLFHRAGNSLLLHTLSSLGFQVITTTFSFFGFIVNPCLFSSGLFAWFLFIFLTSLNNRMSQSWVLKGPLLFPYWPDSLGDQSTHIALNTIYTLMTYTFSIFSLNFHSKL